MIVHWTVAICLVSLAVVHCQNYPPPPPSPSPSPAPPPPPPEECDGDVILCFSPETSEETCFFHLHEKCVEDKEDPLYHYRVNNEGYLENVTDAAQLTLSADCHGQYLRKLYVLSKDNNYLILQYPMDGSEEFSSAYPYFVYNNQWHQFSTFSISGVSSGDEFYITGWNNSVVVHNVQPLNTRARDEKSTPLNAGVIAGICAGAFVLLLVVILAFCMGNRHMDSKEFKAAPKQASETVEKNPFISVVRTVDSKWKV